MNDRSLVFLGAIIGAAVGAGAGFVLFTERGRQLRADLQPEIETVMREAVRLGQVVEELRTGQPAAMSASTATGPAAWPRRAQ